jgi:hypothetical protein
MLKPNHNSSTPHKSDFRVSVTAYLFPCSDSRLYTIQPPLISSTEVPPIWNFLKPAVFGISRSDKARPSFWIGSRKSSDGQVLPPKVPAANRLGKFTQLALSVFCYDVFASRCSNWNPSKNFEKRQNAANLCVFRAIKQASQASDVGSIPIARSRNPDDSTTLTRLGGWKTLRKLRVLDGRWTEAVPIGRNRDLRYRQFDLGVWKTDLNRMLARYRLCIITLASSCGEAGLSNLDFKLVILVASIG